MGGKLDYLDLIHFCLKDKVVSIVARCTIDQEDMPRLVRSAVVVLDKMIQPNHTDTLISVSRWGDSNNLMPSHILMKPRHYNHYSRLSRENIKDVTCQSDRQSDRQFDRQLAWALRTGFTLARWLANPMHLCYANLGYALLYINIWQRTLLLSFLFSLRFFRQYKRIERTSGCFFFCLRDIGTITTSGIALLSADIHSIIVRDMRFSGILVYISLIPIGTTTSSPIGMQILAPFLLWY